MALDPAANATADGDTEIGAAGAAVRSVVAREDLEMAGQTRATLR